MPREDVVALLLGLGLGDDEAEAVIAHGVAMGILRDDTGYICAS
ncbi:MAG: hypothetical protein QM820_58170 [Minicystis sp.]